MRNESKLIFIRYLDIIHFLYIIIQSIHFFKYFFSYYLNLNFIFISFFLSIFMILFNLANELLDLFIYQKIFEIHIIISLNHCIYLYIYIIHLEEFSE